MESGLLVYGFVVFALALLVYKMLRMAFRILLFLICVAIVIGLIAWAARIL